MSTGARKARKRAGQPHVRTPKKPTGYRPGKPPTLGLTTGAEIIAGILTHTPR